MDWFRHYHGLCTDPKLHRIARTAKVSRGLVIAAWCAILETASQNDPRGLADDVDETALAFLIDVKPGVAGRILEAIRATGLIDEEGHVAAWNKRQRASDDVAVRVAKHRERTPVNEVLGKKRFQHDRDPDANPLPENETQAGGNVTNLYRTEQNRTDTEREDSPPAGGSSSNGQYRWAGQIIRLTDKDFNQWTESFGAIDLPCQLAALDAHLASPQAKDHERKRWFPFVAGALKNRNEDARAKERLAAKRQSDPRPNPVFTL
jgi:hypothetical protein